MIICKFCNIEKPETDYSVYKSGNYRKTCKKCRCKRLEENRIKKGKRVREKSAFLRWENNKMFGGNRVKVLIRDGYICKVCGMTNEEHIKKWGRDLVVHHIDGFGRGVEREIKNNNLDNLQTLCTSCHSRLHALKRLVFATAS